MSPAPVYISGIGIISSLGSGLSATEHSLAANQSGIKPLCLFPLLRAQPLPVGQAADYTSNSPLPRTHQLAEIAAEQAMTGCRTAPDAIIVGTTTGGILRTEELLRTNEQAKSAYRYHGLTTVAEELARTFTCSGPALTVSTACSSGAVAITLAMRLLQDGTMERILAGGVDSLCRLTYFGFHSLQLVDRTGCKPLDINRQGMSVAEGAAFLLLTRNRPEQPLAELRGAGLSCDAYHGSSPHPEGLGALLAMQAALLDAGIKPAEVDYLSLHGTGTLDNDLAEAKAVHRLFAEPPPLSSIKGATGHPLAASGAIEAVAAALAVARGLLPANTGCRQPDPALDLQPITQPLRQPTARVLSNSFGFGGNNCCLVIGASAPKAAPVTAVIGPKRQRTLLAIHGSSCLTGAGDQPATLSRFLTGRPVAGLADLEALSANLPPRLIRRLKRLPRMALFLAVAAHEHAGLRDKPASVFLGTGWGALSETYDFLTRLTESEEQFPSPTDFIGSVHNGPASQIAIMFEATGANITTSGGNYSFAQALLAADLAIDDGEQTALVLGVDEGHHVFSPLLDSSIPAGAPLADGGGAFMISKQLTGASYSVTVPFYLSGAADGAISSLIQWCGGKQQLAERCGAILADIPLCRHSEAETQLEQFVEQAGLSIAVIRYRSLLGEFASASAAAAVLATLLLENGTIPNELTGSDTVLLAGKNILVLGFGEYLTAMEFARL